MQVLRTFLPRFVQALLFGRAAGGIILLLGCVWAVIVGFLQTSRLTVHLLLDKFHGEKKWSYRYVIKNLELEVSEAG